MIETKYELRISYYRISSYTHEHKCKDADELRKYLNYELDFDIEEVDDEDIVTTDLITAVVLKVKTTIGHLMRNHQVSFKEGSKRRFKKFQKGKWD